MAAPPPAYGNPMPPAPPRQNSPVIPILIAILLIVGGGWWYVSHNGPGSATTSSTGTPSAPSVSKAALRIHGSNTIGSQLAPALAVEFLKSKGADNVTTRTTAPDETEVTGTLSGMSSPTIIEIQAHGSATAFTDLLGGKCDLGMASRKIEDGEQAKASAAGLGDLTSLNAENVLGLDGIAVIVNKSNPVTTLTKDQIARIFSGELTNWSAVGGNPGPIKVFARDDKSGTFDTFKSLVLKKAALVSAAERLEDSTQLSNRVSADSGAIGFIGLPYVLNSKALAVSEGGATMPLFPNRLTVATEDYPLARRLFLYLPVNSNNRLASDFVHFALSKQGQDIVGKTGFVSQNPEEVRPTENASGAPALYQQLTRGKSRLTLNFRFRSGRATLDNKALEDITRVVNFVTDLKIGGNDVVLMGFADNVGSNDVNLRLSKERAEAVAQQFEMNGLRAATVDGLGSAMPVASNADDAGREKNRRVEIWVNR